MGAMGEASGRGARRGGSRTVARRAAGRAGPRAWLALILALAAGSARADPWGPAGRSRVTGNGSILFPFEEEIVRLRADGPARAAGIRSVALLVAPVDLAERRSGGVVPRPEWDALGQEALVAGVEAALAARGLSVRRVDPTGSGPTAEAWRQLLRLHDAVVGAILFATYEHAFPAKLAAFDYGLGDLSALLAAEGVDALVVAGGACRISSGSRQVQEFLGQRAAYRAAIHLTLADRRGEVLWYVLLMSGRQYDLRVPHDAERLARRAAAGLPGGAP